MIRILLIAVVFSTIIGRVPVWAQTDYCSKAVSMVGTIERNHYSPKPLDDRFSELVFDEFFRLIDPNASVFTLEDIRQLESYRTRIDDELKSRSCVFLERAAQAYRRKLVWLDSLTRAALGKPVAYSENEVFEINLAGEFAGYASNDQALESRWRSILAYLNLLNSTISADSLALPEAFQTIEPAARARTLQTQLCRLEKNLNPLEGFANFVGAQFLKAIAHAYDPHTEFFSSLEIQALESSLSRSAYSFGIHLDENLNGELVIVALSPGSPAWNSGELQDGDVVMEMVGPGNIRFDFTCLDLYEAYEALESAGLEEVKFVVRKPNGAVKTVSLRKQKIEMEENIVRSFILEGKKKVGYISLPTFYTQFEDENALGCANDVAKEIVKMKREKIDGLILDLRFNGGGAMKEAVELAGIFIDHGPVVISKENKGPPAAIKDMNRGSVYDGPMLTMVNGMSASASEIFAAAMQDYKRAVIFGCPTYGKATSQIILPLGGNYLNDGDEDYVKMTTGKFFRLDGSSHQLVGVKPDILAPDFYSRWEDTEKDFASALPAEQIEKKVWFAPHPPLPIAELSAKSRERIAACPVFRKMNEYLPLVSANFRFHLSPSRFVEDIRNAETFFNNLEEGLSLDSAHFSVSNLQHNQEAILLNGYKNDINSRMAESIGQDAYVNEAFLIMCDLIQLNNNPK